MNEWTPNYLAHHGIKGQKWGVRRFQNKDGSLTASGKKQRAKGKLDSSTEVKMIKDLSKQYYGDKRIKSVAVLDKKTGEHIGVNEEILKKKGRLAAIKDARDEASLSKARKVEMSYFDKLHGDLRQFYDDDNQAFEKAVDMFHEVSGYSKSAIKDLHKKYSTKQTDVLKTSDNYYIDYLAHHGILGQKWGKKSGPPYPLDQKAHDSVVKSAGSEQRFAAVQRGGGSAASLHTSNAGKQGRFAKTINKVTGMDASALRIKSKEDLKMAKKCFATYTLGKNEMDTILKTNTKMSRIQTSKEMESFPFYATYKKHDVEMYEGLFGKNLKSRALAAAKASGDAEEITKAKGMEVYRVELKNTKGLKVPSEENAGNITANLLKNKEFKDNLRTSIAESKTKMKRPSQQLLFNKAEKALEKQQNDLTPEDKKTIYKALNLTLTYHNQSDLAVQKEFYSALQKKGYGAIVDTNDQEYSSYHAKRPMIVFDTQSTAVDKVHTLDEKRVNKLNTRYNAERIAKEAIEQTLGTPMKYLRG